MKGRALRRVLHASSAAVLVIPLAFDWNLLRLLLVATALVAVTVDMARIRIGWLRQQLARMVPVFRETEATRICGATWLSLGYALAAWFPPIAPAAGILVGAFADPAASAAGSWKASSKGKTARGSSAALITAALALTAIGLPWQAVVAGSLVGAMLERWPGPCSDNLLVAPGVACTVWLLT